MSKKRKRIKEIINKITKKSKEIKTKMQRNKKYESENEE